MASAQLFDIDVQDVEYQNQDGKNWLARVYRPVGAGPFPTMVDVHGGAWNNGDRMNNTSMDQALAARGVVVASLDFRQPPEAAYPASIADLNVGTRWLKAHAAELGGTSAVGAIGVSSGGHMVVLSGLRPTFPSYAALPQPDGTDEDASLAYVIACWPVIDPLYRYLFASKQPGREALLQSHLNYWGSEAGMTAGSPQAIVEEDESIEKPPILMMLKANDTNHPVEMQERFVASYRQRGGAITSETFTGLPERGMDASLPEAIRALDMIVDFARQHTPA